MVDSTNARVLEFKAPLSNGMAASLVIGQTNFQNIYPCNGGYVTRTQPPASPTASVFCGPDSVTVDSANDVWVGDGVNGRVLEFAPPFSNGMDASLELGWPASAPFTSGDGSVCNGVNPISATSICTPAGEAFDPNGNLWVSDGVNPRILQFMPPFTNGMAASLVIGETSFTSFHDISVSAKTLGLHADGIGFDRAGNLYVADGGANRVLLFAPPFSNDMSASIVLGQPDMTSSGQNQAQNNAPGGPPTAQTLLDPTSVLPF